MIMCNFTWALPLWDANVYLLIHGCGLWENLMRNTITNQSIKQESENFGHFSLPCCCCQTFIYSGVQDSVRLIVCLLFFFFWTYCMLALITARVHISPFFISFKNIFSSLINKIVVGVRLTIDIGRNKMQLTRQASMALWSF